MGLYEFQFFDTNGDRPMLNFLACRDDEDAAREALAQLRQHESCQGVEIYDGERVVAKVERPLPEDAGRGSRAVPRG